MKRIVSFIVAAVMCFAMLTVVSAAPAQAEEAKEPITITFACFHMENETDSVVFTIPWLELIKEACAEKGYDVEFECYWGGTLCNVAESYKAVAEGMADMSLFLTNMAGIFNAEQAVSFGWNGVDLKNPSKIYETLYLEFPDIQNEYKDVKVLALLTEAGQEVNCNKLFTDREDAASQNILWCSVGPASHDITVEWGWSPVSLLPEENYSGLERGIIDGTTGKAKTMSSMAWDEVTKYRYDNLYMINQMVSVIMNKDFWEELPAEVQEVFEYYGLGGEFNVTQYYDDAIKAAEDELSSQLKMEHVSLEPEALEGFQEGIDAAADKWAASMDEQGIAGTEILARTRELVEELSAE